MSRLTGRAATAIAVAVAIVAFLNALNNGWAGDDPLILRDNLRVHSFHSALAAWFLPYWPPPWQDAGLYRPLTILSYGIDWSLGNGRLWVFHLTNILLNAAACGLVVRIALAWLPPAGALVTGLLFALHPVHVEAVSNIVGRAELLAAVAVLVSVLAARGYRHAPSQQKARLWLALTLAAVGLALLSKEHAIIAVAVIALDHFLDQTPQERPTAPLYAGVAAVTLTWFHIWRSIVGGYVPAGATTAFYGLTPPQRWATMFPVQLDILRLLVWPMQLASDYSQQTVVIRTAWTIIATLGLVVAIAELGLGLALTRRVPAIAFGILLALGSYLPTSNLLFTSGVVLAERALYLAVLAPALVLGWLVTNTREKEYYRTVIVAVGLVLLVFAFKSWSRTPFWKTPQTAIIEEAGDHPENYRARLHLADLFATKKDTARALAEYLAADALAERDPFLGLFIVNSSISLKRYRLAVEQGRRAYEMAPRDSRPARWFVQALLASGKKDSAVAIALKAALSNRGSLGHVETYQQALIYADAPRKEQLLARSLRHWLSGELVQSSADFDSLAALTAGLPCPEVELASPVISAFGSNHSGSESPAARRDPCDPPWR
jgi:hypothetical protein